MKRLGIVLSILLLLLAFSWVVYTRGPLAPVNVKTAKVQRGDLQPGIFGTGTIEARRSYTIGPTQPGRVLSVLADQGQSVVTGQVLGRIDPVDMEQRINSANIVVQRARNSMSVAEAQVKEAQTRYELAISIANRYGELLKEQAVSQEIVDAKLNEVAVAKTTLEARQSSLQVAKSDMDKAISEYEALEKQRDNLILKAPADGIIVSRDAEPGNTVVAGQAVFHMIDPQSLWVRARIDQDQAQGIKTGQSAGIVLRSRQDKTLPGTVSRIEIQSDSVTEERIVNVSFNKIPANLSVGELVEVTVNLPQVEQVLVVPSAAVKRVNGQYGVWRFVNGKAQFLPVEIGVQTLDGKTQISRGLEESDSVIVYSPVEMREGIRVHVGGEL